MRGVFPPHTHCSVDGLGRLVEAATHPTLATPVKTCAAKDHAALLATMKATRELLIRLIRSPASADPVVSALGSAAVDAFVTGFNVLMPEAEEQVPHHYRRCHVASLSCSRLLYLLPLPHCTALHCMT